MGSLMQVVFGWPAIIATVAASGYGVLANRPRWLSIAAVLSIAPSLYLGGLPLFRGVGFALPLTFLVAALLQARGKRWASALLLVPFYAIAAWLAFAVRTANQDL